MEMYVEKGVFSTIRANRNHCKYLIPQQVKKDIRGKLNFWVGEGKNSFYSLNLHEQRHIFRLTLSWPEIYFSSFPTNQNLVCELYVPRF